MAEGQATKVGVPQSPGERIGSQGSVPSRPPEPFGKYVLLDRIGAGGMAEVFHAVAGGPEGFQQSLVIKRMLPSLSQDAAFVRMFIDEAKLSGLLSHPNLVQMFEFGKVHESFFIAMEYVHGRTLAAIKNQLSSLGRVAPLAASVEIARQICRGLDYAHSVESHEGQSLGIVHRDISPPNVMVDFHGVVKILDFGIARVADGMRDSRTQVGMMKGKISYMSPEQLRLGDIDGRSDVFAVGIVLHEMLTGQRLFKSSTDYESSRMVLELDIPLPSQLNADVFPELDRIVMRALQRDPDARYPTAGEMATDLQRVATQMSFSPHEHLKLLGEIFPGEAMAMKKGTSVTGTRFVASAPALASSDKPTSHISHAALGDGPKTAPGHALDVPGTNPGRSRSIGFFVGVVVAMALLFAILTGSRLGFRSRPAPVAVTPVVEVPVAPPSARIHLSIDSSPQDAQVTRVDTGAVLGRTPLATTVPRSGEVIAFRLEKPDYEPAVYKIIPDLDKIVRVDLGRIPGPASTDRAPENVSDRTASGPEPGPAHAKKVRRRVASPSRTSAKNARHRVASPSTTPATVATKDCFLTVGSFPWAQLWIDGRSSGQPTPVIRYPVTCGPHKLRFKRDSPAIDHVENITVTRDREFKQNFQLVSGDVDE